MSKTISSLKSLKKLTDLDLWHNQITNASSLAGLTNLEKLVLNDNFFIDLTPLLNNFQKIFRLIP